MVPTTSQPCSWCGHSHLGRCEEDANNGGHPGAVCGCLGDICSHGFYVGGQILEGYACHHGE